MAEHPWHDLSFDLSGALAERAQQRFDLDWNYAAHLPSPRFAGLRDEAAAGATQLAQLIPSGPDQVDDTVHALLVSGAFMARERILAVTPYFVPDATLLMALTLAARRGVVVDLVLPARSNHRLADVARNRPLRDLARAGARVWLTSHMVHAKAIVIDDGFALAGSANLDARSLFLNYELMVAFYRPADVAGFAAWIDGERRLASAYRAQTPGLIRDLAEGLCSGSRSSSEGREGRSRRSPWGQWSRGREALTDHFVAAVRQHMQTDRLHDGGVVITVMEHEQLDIAGQRGTAVQDHAAVHVPAQREAHAQAPAPRGPADVRRRSPRPCRRRSPATPSS